MPFAEWVELAATIVEGAGVGAMLLGAAISAVLVPIVCREPRGWYALYRRYLGHSILLGLELLVAADIIRTVSTVPTLERVLVLAAIVLIRTFLSFALEVELEGRWPWQGGRIEPRPRAPPRA